MEINRQIGKLADGTPVYERPASHIHTEYEEIYALMEQVLLEVAPIEDFITYNHTFPHIIGESICVETVPGDEIIFAQRPKRQGKTRFVKNKPLRPTNTFTIVLRKDERSTAKRYFLVTAYVGEKAPPEPWDKHASSSSFDFWSTHALIWGSVDVVAGTETTESPW